MTPTAGHNGPLWPLLLYFAAVVGLVCIMMGLAYLLGEHRDHSKVDYPFESGIIPVGFARFRLSVHFYLVAVMFVLFDVETVFIISWAISFRRTGWTGYAEVLTFIVELVVGLAYLWRLGALDWAPPHSREGRIASRRS